MLIIKQLSAAALIGSSIALASAAPALASGNQSDHKIGICHATGSKTNPYVFITVDQHAAEAHKNHQDGRDVIGAKSAKDCPKTAATYKGGDGNGQVLGSSTAPATLPTELPKTGATAGLSALIGIPSLALAGRAYLRSRHLDR